MSWNVEYTDEFGRWFSRLGETVQDDIDRSVGLLEAKGPQLPFPHSSGIVGSRHEHMREFRVQSRGEPYRIFYAFDPRRTAILLIGGNKIGDDRFYDHMTPLADALYDTYLAELRREGLLQ
ncbi:MAG TPA: type II toxin-antitoxin system RelE/ParE family toxin [Rhizobiaceae bacterium]|nr:type II toxin-antitoxin system RelE/ParE family toxin [Rhizobiaceae bacterium]